MSRSRLRRAAVWTLVVLALGAAGVFWVGRDFFLHRIGTVREGVLYRSAQLSPGKLRDVVAENGIRTIVNLREVPNEEEERLARSLGLHYVWLPSEQVPSEENLGAILDLLDHPDNLPVLVHCEHGVGRTGVVSGMYRLEYEHWSVEDVLREARWYACGGSYWDGQDKTEYLRHYEPREAQPSGDAPPGAR